MRSPSRSVALPLPSSPHWAPTNTITGTSVDAFRRTPRTRECPGTAEVYAKTVCATPACWSSVGSAALRVLLIGSAGREHALAVGLAADPAVEQIIAAPG